MAQRFYETVTVEETAEGFAVLLDRRKLTTPAKNPLLLPHAALANAIAREWSDVAETVNTSAMPLSRLAYTALDRVSAAYAETAEAFAAYGATDLLCYRATHPEALVARQHEIWSPHLDWAASRYDVSFLVGSGVSPIEQSPESLSRLTQIALGSGSDPLRLTGLAHAAGLVGSAVLALRMESGEVAAEEIWRAAFLDEFFQFEQWGEDSEAMTRLEGIRAEIKSLSDYFSLFFS